MVNKMVIFVMLVSLSLLVGPASAVDLNSGMTNQERQYAIDNADPNDYVVNFLTSPGTTYTNVSLIATKDNVEWIGNGVTLEGNGSSILTITNRQGVTIRDFIININNNTADGITGSNVYNCNITNNTITNGDDGINIFMHYGGLTIANNTITDMNNGRDGISLVNHNTTIDMDTYAPTLIESNIIDDVQYGIFLGGNFKGTITGNNISATVAGMNITGKKAATNGILNATICNNNITGGIAMESHHVLFLELCYNTLIGPVAGTVYSIFTNAMFNVEPIYDIIVNFNYLGYNATEEFKDVTTEAHNNTGPGAYLVP